MGMKSTLELTHKTTALWKLLFLYVRNAILIYDSIHQIFLCWFVTQYKNCMEKMKQPDKLKWTYYYRQIIIHTDGITIFIQGFDSL